MRHQQREKDAHEAIFSIYEDPSGFRSVRLPWDVKQNFIDSATKGADEFLQDFIEKGNADWWFAYQRKGVSIFKPHTQNNKRDVFVRGIMEVKLPYDEIVDFYRLKQENCGKWVKLLGNDLVNGKLLTTLVENTIDKPRHTISLKWIAVTSPISFIHDRDIFYTEYTDERINAEGRRIWYTSLKSVEEEYVHMLQPVNGHVRANITRTGFVIEETSHPGRVRLTHTAQIDPKGTIPMFVTALSVETKIASLSSLEEKIRQFRLRQKEFVQPHQHVPDNERNVCIICQRGFSAWIRRHHCRRCGEIICGKCYSTRRVDIPVVGNRRIKICNQCYEEPQWKNGRKTTTGRTGSTNEVEVATRLAWRMYQRLNQHRLSIQGIRYSNDSCSYEDTSDDDATTQTTDQTLRTSDDDMDSLQSSCPSLLTRLTISSTREYQMEMLPV